jgi:hypothetical protein
MDRRTDLFAVIMTLSTAHDVMHHDAPPELATHATSESGSGDLHVHDLEREQRAKAARDHAAKAADEAGEAASAIQS